MRGFPIHYMLCVNDAVFWIRISYLLKSVKLVVLNFIQKFYFQLVVNEQTIYVDKTYHLQFNCHAYHSYRFSIKNKCHRSNKNQLKTKSNAQNSC